MDTTFKVIKSEQDHARAVENLLNLMTAGDGENTEAIELLALVIQDYERKKSPPPPVDAIDAIHFRMEQMGMAAKDLIPYLGSQSKVSEVLNRKRPLTLAMIRNLHKGLGIPAEVLLSEDHGPIDLASDPEFDATKFPLSEMAKRGYFGEKYKCTPIQQLKASAEELVRSFFNAIGTGGHSEFALLRAPQSQNGTRTMNDYALEAWVARVKQQARNQVIETSYKDGAITHDWMRELVKLSRFKEGPKLAKEYLARRGIVLVIEPHFKKTYLDGAAMLDGDRAIIGMTLRHDRLDNFWFVLLHEIAHIQRHLNADCRMIADDLDDKVQQAQAIEKEADNIAQEAFISAEQWSNSAVSKTHLLVDAQQLARELDISVSIVAGRVRNTTKNWRLLQTSLGRGEVKAMFGIGGDD
jgi:HTH-type transcriptional regulator/antitoxin HigA